MSSTVSTVLPTPAKRSMGTGAPVILSGFRATQVVSRTVRIQYCVKIKEMLEILISSENVIDSARVQGDSTYCHQRTRLAHRTAAQLSQLLFSEEQGR